jgi:hypothetical protein
LGRSTAWSAGCAAALADTLRKRGVEEPEASLTAEAGFAVFRIAFERWTTADDQRDLPTLIRESLEALRGGPPSGDHRAARRLARSRPADRGNVGRT